mmetsp:Transcript_15888/g.23929  ORF Transcript_15888/g.23929 Transcript_15888/m.23929 type:complete len:213 (-) Transcript_15888:170-808(-)
MKRLIIITCVLAVSLPCGVSRTYKSICESAFCHVISEVNKELIPLKNTVDSGEIIPKFGAKAEQICNSALEMFSIEAPLPDGDNKDDEAIYDEMTEELERTVDWPLQVIFLKQVALLRERTLSDFKGAIATGKSEYEALTQVDQKFQSQAEDSIRLASDWDYITEISSLKSALCELAAKNRAIEDVKLEAAKYTQQAVDIISTYHQADGKRT